MLKIFTPVVMLLAFCCGASNTAQGKEGAVLGSTAGTITVKYEKVTEEININKLNKDDIFVMTQLAYSDNNLLIYINNEYFFNCKGEITASNVYDLKTKKYTFKGAVKDGKVYSLKEDGSFKTVFMYKNNKKNGLAVTYGEKNNVIVESNYVDDLLDGVTKEYSEEGKLETEKTYKNGVLEKEVEY